MPFLCQGIVLWGVKEGFGKGGDSYEAEGEVKKEMKLVKLMD